MRSQGKKAQGKTREKENRRKRKIIMLETIPWIAAGLGWTTAGVMSYMAYRRRSPQSQKKTKKRPVPLAEAIFEDPNSMALIKDDYLPQRTMMVSRDVYESLKKATKQGKETGR